MSLFQSFDFGRYLTRLGVKAQAEPEFVYSVQPVQVVSDASGLTAPLLPPSGAFGFSVAAPGAGNYAIAGLISKAPGGTLARATVQTARLAWAFSAPSFVTGIGGTAGVPIVYQADVLAAMEFGSIAFDAIAATDPQYTANIVHDFTVFIPSGSALIIQAGFANSVLEGWIAVEEFTSLRGT